MKIINLPHDNNFDQMRGMYGPPGREASLGWFPMPSQVSPLFPDQGVAVTVVSGSAMQIHRHRCHAAVALSLGVALAAIHAQLGAHRYKAEGWADYAGCYNPRRKRGGAGWSTHAWGVAIDLDPARNPYKSDQRTLSDEGMEIMERHGWLSGWRAWGHDAMHFQRAIPAIRSGSYYASNGLPRWIEPLAI